MRVTASVRATANEFSQDLWQILRNRRCRSQKFRREYPIRLHNTDFDCPAFKLIIEVDGKDHHTDEGRERDEHRDKY